jgi:hypothetical protein
LIFNMLSSSPDRGSFQINAQLERIQTGEATAEESQSMIEFYQSHQAQIRAREADPEWQANNMEHDLRSTDWIVAKARASEAYAQNLYAAMCNREFQRNEVWPLLKNQTWSCSWRYAGGIVADMRGEGDYMDWYCSGIRGGATESELAEMTVEQQERYHWYEKNFVSESVVTDEIQQDLQKLGWIVLPHQETY